MQCCMNTRNDNSQRKKKRGRKKKKEADAVENGEDSKVNSEQLTKMKHKNKSQKQSQEMEGTQFPDYIPVKEIIHIFEDQSTTNKEYVKGYLRINPAYCKHAYVSISEWDVDLLIISVTNRNRALEGDLVVARVNPPEQWKISENSQHKTGTVVCILDKIHPRRVIGCLKQYKSYSMFYPRDFRVPLIKIYPDSIPNKFSVLPNLFDGTLCVATILSWRKPQFAIGKITEVIGSVGNVAAESSAIILEHNLDVTPYSPNILKEIPSSDYLLTADDLKNREDWRDECIFTIDPATAVDLDDAVSCKHLNNGNYEIGVHIADVTHFLEFLSPLDLQVAKRATTVYMTHDVYHMLPPQLCHICSLLPGQDKLAFSVIWEITPKAEVISHRFAKTVIRSCCQMSYQQAQTFIENSRENWPDNSLNIKGPFVIEQLSEVVSNLYKLSVQLREKRFSDGALCLNQPKLHVLLDKATALPISYCIEEHADSNRLIEEFMLLANITVATHLYKTMPDTALLRNHQKPSTMVLDDTKSMLEKFGVHLEIDCAQALQASIQRYELVLDSNSEESKTIAKYRMLVINNLCAKAMQRATYRCSSTVPTEEELRHYALNVPLYTHFTSPIRRYADCIVHRLLYSSIHKIPLPDEWSEKLCAKFAANCNVKKYHAKLAQENSTILYFTYLVELMGGLVASAIVVEVRDKKLNVILCEVGIKLPIYFNDMESVASVHYSTEYCVPTVTISWKEPTQTQMITVFTLVNLRVQGDQKCNKLTGTLLPPRQAKLL